MTGLKQSLILDFIKMYDPTHQIISIDSGRKEIRYNVRNTYAGKFNDEEFVRAYYVIKLIKLSGFKKDDILVEQEYVFQIGRGKKPIKIDIVVLKEDKPFILLEVKSPTQYDSEKYKAIRGQLFGVSDNLQLKDKLNWLVYATTYAESQIEEEALTIDYKLFSSWQAWRDSNERSFSQIPDTTSRFTEHLIKGKVTLKPLSKETIMKLKRRLHNTLWRGGGTRGDNKVFFNLLKLIISKVYDEHETQDAMPFTFQLKYAGNAVDYDKTYNAVQDLYSKTLQNKNYLDFDPSKLAELSKIEKGIDSIELTEEEIAFVVSELQNYSLTITDYDALAIFFETILREEFKQNVGSFFTHSNIVTFMLYAVGLDELTKSLITQDQRLPYIIDPSVGSGTFLIEAMRTITKTVIEQKHQLIVNETIRRLISKQFDDNLKVHPWAQEYIYGIDRNPHLLLTTKVNMIMHGDGHVHVYPSDALNEFGQFDDLLKKERTSIVYSGKVNEQFDIILSNPPFSMDIEQKSKERYREIFPSLGQKSSEVLFIERWYQLLREKGRVAVVLPESVFDTTDNLDVRMFLYKYFWVKAIISLPEGMKKGAFGPYTGTKTSLLLCQKKENDEVKQWDVLWNAQLDNFYYVKNELEKYFGKGRKQGTSSTILQHGGEKERKCLIDLLKEYIDDMFAEYDSDLSINGLVEKYEDDFRAVEKDTWLFRRVVKDLSSIYPAWKTTVLIIHTDQIGYKRTKRREDVTVNRLYKADKNGVIINSAQPENILDLLWREVQWSN